MVGTLNDEYLLTYIYMDQLRFYYGIEGRYKDVTQTTFEKCKVDTNSIKLPLTEQTRTDIYGDPIFGVLKHMVVEFEGVRYVVREFTQQLVIICDSRDTIKQCLNDYNNYNNRGLQIYYGVEGQYANVTLTCREKCMDTNKVIKLPITEDERERMYADPVVGRIKHMLVTFNDSEIRCVVRPFSRQLVINCADENSIRASLEDYLHWDRVVPIYIIAFNYYTYVKNMVDQLLKFTKNVIIVDNKSSYPVLLEYYRTCGVTVIYNSKNYNVQTELYDLMEPYMPEYYVITDPDLQFSERMMLDGLDLLNTLKILIDRYGTYKAGLALELDNKNFKNVFMNGYSIYTWERQYWSNILEPGVYRAGVDTTFTMCCRRNFRGNRFDAVRLANGYECKHLPWYKNPAVIVPEEEAVYYRDTQKFSSFTSLWR